MMDNGHHDEKIIAIPFDDPNYNMYKDIEERSRALAAYLLEHQCTVRAAAERFGVSKSTVHKDMSERLEYFDRALWLQVRALLERNKAERHIRGGIATRIKYKGK